MQESDTLEFAREILSLKPILEILCLSDLTVGHPHVLMGKMNKWGFPELGVPLSHPIEWDFPL